MHCFNKLEAIDIDNLENAFGGHKAIPSILVTIGEHKHADLTLGHLTGVSRFERRRPRVSTTILSICFRVC